MSFILFVISFLVALASFSVQNPMKHIEDITKTYFSGESLLFIYWTNVSTEFRLELLKYWASSEILKMENCNCDYVTDDIIYGHSFVKNTVVLFGDMIPEQKDIQSMKQCLSWNARSKILAITNSSEEIAAETLKKMWKFSKAMNVTIMTLSSVRYYTLYPYQNFKIVELDQDDIFPTKPLYNLQGSVIRAAINACEPYVLADKIPNVYTDGLEIRIIQHMAKKYNFNLEVIKPPKGENPWMVLSADKRRLIGNFGLLDRCEVDLAAYGVQIREDRYLLADYTAIHTIDKMVWVVPIRPFTFNWRSIIIVFQNDLWAGLFISLILIAGTLYLITKYESSVSYNFFDAFFQTLGIHLSVPIYFYRKSQLYRLFVFTISYYTMIIVALYQSSLITYLTTRGSKDQYETIEEVVDNGLIGYLFPSGRPSYNLTNHNLWNKILSPGGHIYSENSPTMIRSVGYNKSTYTLMMDSVAKFEIHKTLLDENHKPMVRVLPKLFLPYLATIFTSKGHPLRDLIRDNIMRLFESGILGHWMNDIILKNLKMYGGAKSSNDGPVALSIEHLRGAFYILPVLFTLAGVVFICEVFYFWWTVKNKREDVVKTRNKCLLDNKIRERRYLYLKYEIKRKAS